MELETNQILSTSYIPEAKGAHEVNMLRQLAYAV